MNIPPARGRPTAVTTLRGTTRSNDWGFITYIVDVVVVKRDGLPAGGSRTGHDRHDPVRILSGCSVRTIDDADGGQGDEVMGHGATLQTPAGRLSALGTGTLLSARTRENPVHACAALFGFVQLEYSEAGLESLGTHAFTNIRKKGTDPRERMGPQTEDALEA